MFAIIPSSLQSFLSHLTDPLPTFPDQLPFIFLPHDVSRQARRIPHLNREREFCTFDRTEVRINTDNPEGIVLAVIERARKLLEEGVTGSNHGDYLGEFEAYWEQGVGGKVLSLVPPEECVRNIICLRLNKPWKGWSFLFAADETTGGRWLSSVGYRQGSKSDPALLYLPLKSLGVSVQVGGRKSDQSIDSSNKALYALSQCWIVLTSQMRIGSLLPPRFNRPSLLSITNF